MPWRQAIRNPYYNPAVIIRLTRLRYKRNLFRSRALHTRRTSSGWSTHLMRDWSHTARGNPFPHPKVPRPFMGSTEQYASNPLILKPTQQKARQMALIGLHIIGLFASCKHRLPPAREPHVCHPRHPCRSTRSLCQERFRMPSCLSRWDSLSRMTAPGAQRR